VLAALLSHTAQSGIFFVQLSVPVSVLTSAVTSKLTTRESHGNDYRGNTTVTAVITVVMGSFYTVIPGKEDKDHGNTAVAQF